MNDIEFYGKPNGKRLRVPVPAFALMPHKKGVGYGVMIFDWLGGKKVLPGKDRPYAIYRMYKAFKGFEV